MRRLLAPAVLAILLPAVAAAQVAFDVASIRPSSQNIPFERDGQTSIEHGTLRMRAVTAQVCIAWAYSVSSAQIIGPAALTAKKYDITAKGGGMSETQARLALQALLAERFGLTLHREHRVMQGYILTALAAAKPGPRFHPSPSPGEMVRQNSAAGTVARNITMPQFAGFLSGALRGPVSDQTGLPGPYDLDLDFTPHVDLTGKPSDLPNAAYVLNAALKGELGLQITPRKSSFEVIVVDHLTEPTPN